jgi:class 3 adenylate cyclase
VVSDICGNDFGDIYFAIAEQGILRLRNGQFKLITTEHGLLDLSISGLACDNKNNLWIATLGGGIMRYDSELFLNYSQVDNFGSGISSLFVNPQGEAIFGLNSGQLYCWNQGQKSVCDFGSPSISAPIFDITKDQQDNIWIAADNEGLWSLKSGKWQKSEIPGSEKARFITVTATHDAIYAGSFSDGLFIIKNEESWQFMPDNLKGKDVWVIFEDSKNRIWLGTDKADLWLLSPDGKSGTQIGKKDGLPGNLIYSISEDKFGNIWLALKDRGICMLKADAAEKLRNDGSCSRTDFIVFSSSDLLMSNLVDLVHCDQNNHLWVGTSKGIQRFDLSGDYNNPLINPRHYGLYEGLRGVQANTRKVFEDANGKIWWGMSKYLCIYQSKEDGEDSGAPMVFLDGLKLAPGETMKWNESTADSRFRTSSNYFASIWRNYIYFSSVSPWNGMPENLVLSHNLNRLIFDYHAINWKGEDKIRYQIMLEGLDKNWRDAGSGNGMEYPSLPPGTYTFKVRASNEAGIWSNPAEFRFIIQEPFWQTTWFLISIIIALIAATALFFRYRLKRLQKENLILEEKVKERTEDLRKEKVKSDNLLLNILPEKTAEELKERGEASTRNYPSASVLFSDFKGFTMLTETITPAELIFTLDSFFKAFDEAAPVFGVEKIKTIGDAYMCAAGIPVEDAEHARKLVGFALEMIRLTEELNHQRTKDGLKDWHLRIGIHSGPLISGVVGKRKFAYDIWGDTVNIAARMESSGEVNRVNISASTYDLVKDHFECESRGKIAAKNKGDMDMYFVLGPKKH